MSTNASVIDRIQAGLSKANQGNIYQAPSTGFSGASPYGDGISLQGGMMNSPGSTPKKLGTSIVSA